MKRPHANEETACRHPVCTQHVLRHRMGDDMLIRSGQCDKSQKQALMCDFHHSDIEATACSPERGSAVAGRLQHDARRQQRVQAAPRLKAARHQVVAAGAGGGSGVRERAVAAGAARAARRAVVRLLIPAQFTGDCTFYGTFLCSKADLTQIRPLARCCATFACGATYNGMLYVLMRCVVCADSVHTQKVAEQHARWHRLWLPCIYLRLHVVRTQLVARSKGPIN